jgi:hypothetical protein
MTKLNQSHAKEFWDLALEARRENSRKSMSQSIQKCMKELLDMPEPEVKQIFADASQPMVRRLAARRMILAMEYEDPRSDRAFDQIFDRSDGKPAQSHSIEVTQIQDPSQLLSDLREELGRGDDVIEVTDEEVRLLGEEAETEMDELVGEPVEETPPA